MPRKEHRDLEAYRGAHLEEHSEVPRSEVHSEARRGAHPRARRKIGAVCMAMGVVLIASALSLFLWNLWDDNRAASSVDNVLTQLVAMTGSGSDDTGAEISDVDGRSYIGYLFAPTVGMELPVIDSWSYENLRVAPCVYSGSAAEDDLVICAHNYSSHFGVLTSLSIGDPVYFTDMSGKTITYEVEEIEELAPTAVEDMIAGDYDLTLFTCNYSGQARVTVRCNRV